MLVFCLIEYFWVTMSIHDEIRRPPPVTLRYDYFGKADCIYLFMVEFSHSWVVISQALYSPSTMATNQTTHEPLPTTSYAITAVSGRSAYRHQS